MTLHSFAILAHSESQYLPGCIESLLSQTVKSAIYISTSTPSEFLRAIGDKYRVPIHINNGKGGIADDWTHAYRICNTPYVTLAHQDDIYCPKYAEVSIAIAEKCGNNIITFTDYLQLQDGKSYSWNLNLLVKRLLLLPFILNASWNSKLVKRGILTFGNSICCPSVMYHKAKIGDFRFSEKYLYNLDWDAWIRLADMDGSFAYVRRPMMYHRIHSESQTSIQTKSNRRAEEELKCLTRLMPSYLAYCYSVVYKLGKLSNRV